MIDRVEVQGVHFIIDENLQKYINKKLARLDRYMAAHTAQSSHLEITLKESKAKSGKQCHCNVTLHLPKETLEIKESTVNMFAAIDIAEAKLKMQLKKYKDLHDSSKLRQRLTVRLRSRKPTSTDYEA